MSLIIRCEDDNSISRAARALADGELVIFPTETVYALAARADSDAAIDKIYAAKQRDVKKALTLMASSFPLIAANFLPDSRLEKLMARFSPGPITVIARCKKELPSLSKKVNLANDAWLGVRIPHHEWALELLSRLGFPIVATSCNLSGSPAATSIRQLDRMITNRVALVVDGGEAEHRTGSTIVKLNAPIELVRQGPISLEQIILWLDSSD